MIRHDGSDFPVEISTGVFERDGRGMSVCILRDVTERHRLDRGEERVRVDGHDAAHAADLDPRLAGASSSPGAGGGVLPDKAKSLLGDRAQEQRAPGRTDQRHPRYREDRGRGRIEFRHDQLEESVLVDQAVEMNRAYAAEHGAVEYWVSARRPDRPLLAQGDAGRIIQVLTNLLSNAAKFSPRGAVVDVAVHAFGNACRISVRDYGVGIPEECPEPDLSALRPGRRPRQRRARRKGGSGLQACRSPRRSSTRHGEVASSFRGGRRGNTRFWPTLPPWPKRRRDRGRIDEDPEFLDFVEGNCRKVRKLLSSSGHCRIALGGATRSPILRGADAIAHARSLEFCSRCHAAYGRGTCRCASGSRTPSAGKSCSSRLYAPHDLKRRGFSREVTARARSERRKGPALLSIPTTTASAGFEALVRKIGLRQVGGRRWPMLGSFFKDHEAPGLDPGIPARSTVSAGSEKRQGDFGL